ncbi:MAG: thrombospondin type 3 repeat-containing protein, partial [Verrucomicrobiota bacterium]|nr:thrombospondin type 3 repeat-containing protein [Verrucomicrobiota bacterium]
QAYVDILKHHRILLSDWLSAGDCGIRKESIQALQSNGEGTKWGEGVNVEYEVYRADSDGDGLSDKWESLNGRDPLDGNLYYEFDCGGWQTEGWISPNISSNLAGFLGYLDFYLDDKVATLRREGLKVIQKKENQTFILRLRTSKDLNVKVLINEQLIGLESIQSSNEYEQVSMNFRPKLGQEIVELLEVVFEGEEGAFVEIDTILLETI